MQTQNTEHPTIYASPVTEDVVRRGIKRDLPCRLTEPEFMRISKQRVAKEAELTQLQADLVRETKKRKDQIGELEDEIAKMGRELHTEHQDRIVPCNDVFRRDPIDGTGWIHTIRLDTFEEVERKPATAHETQRYLPAIDGPGAGILDQARAKQKRSAQDDVPAGDAVEADLDMPPDDGEGDLEDQLDGAMKDADKAEAKAKAKKNGKGK
jgi:hypothetical protein